MFNATKMSEMRKVVRDGVFKAKLNNLFLKDLSRGGYSSVELRAVPSRYEIVIIATKTQSVLSKKGANIRSLATRGTSIPVEWVIFRTINVTAAPKDVKKGINPFSLKSALHVNRVTAHFSIASPT